jgi:hypothetical protein
MDIRVHKPAKSALFFRHEINIDAEETRNEQWLWILTKRSMDR